MLTAFVSTDWFRWYLVQYECPVMLKDLALAVQALASIRIGALIAILRRDSLMAWADTGIPLDAQFSYDLMLNIFIPGTPLHDGAVVVSGDQVLAAGCILPLSQNPRLAYQLGTRHRAALGMTEETDALVIVVSEESGHISIAEGGRLIPNLDPGSLRSNLASLVRGGDSKDGAAKRKTKKEKAAEVAESAARS